MSETTTDANTATSLPTEPDTGLSVPLGHLTFPNQHEAALALPTPVETTQPRPLSKNRLYIGNLHPTVDEYTLIQLFSKFGKIGKMDFLFHKTGPMKGKPRGYAFVEYVNATDAATALARAHDKLVRGRKLVVTYAQQAPLDQDAGYDKRRRAAAAAEVNKPTTLSLLKSHGSGMRSSGTANKIALMEAKLKELEGVPLASSSSTLPAHPSLPRKPPPTVPQATQPAPNTGAKASPPTIPRPSGPNPAPSLPKIVPVRPPTPQFRPTASATQAAPKKPSKLAGVRINKAPKPAE